VTPFAPTIGFAGLLRSWATSSPERTRSDSGRVEGVGACGMILWRSLPRYPWLPALLQHQVEALH
jgi:hypothetical protein